MALGSTRAIRRITIFYFLPSIERSVASIERVSPTRARASSHAVPRERTSHAVPPTNGRRRDARRRSRPLRARVFPRILEIIGSPIDRESRRDDDAPPRRVRDDVGVQGSSARPRAPRSSIVRAATPTRRRRARPRDRRDRCNPIDRAGKKKKMRRRTLTDSSRLSSITHDTGRGPRRRGRDRPEPLPPPEDEPNDRPAELVRHPGHPGRRRGSQARSFSSHWFPYDPVGAVNADP